MTQMVYTIGRYDGQGINMLGTGFLIANGKFIVVPRHVVGDNDNGLGVILPSISSMDECQDTTITSCRFANVTIKNSDPFRDIVILELKNQTFSFPTPEIGSIEDVSVGEDILIFGFPHCVEGRRVLTMQKALVGAKILLNSSGVKSKFCVINTQTRPGQSGSIIYSPTKNKIIGILIGAFVSNTGILLGRINPNELHQTTQCLSAEYIKNMIGE